MAEIKQAEARVVNRSSINLADYNPRTITAAAKKKLKESLEVFGLVGGIVLNERTNTLVSGHQRIACLDSIYGNKEYDLTVTVVDVDVEMEKKLNISLNNPESQGEFDMEKLQNLMSGLKDLTGSGFTETDKLQMFGANLGGYDEEQYKEAVKKAEEVQQVFKKAKEIQDTSADNFYTVVVFKEATERALLYDRLGLDGNKFVAWVDFFAALKAKIQAGEI